MMETAVISKHRIILKEIKNIYQTGSIFNDLKTVHCDRYHPHHFYMGFGQRMGSG